MTFIGFTVGPGRIASHLLVDFITPWGLEPIRPFSQRSYRIARIPTDSTYANYGLLILGVRAFGTSIAAVTGFFESKGSSMSHFHNDTFTLLLPDPHNLKIPY